LGPEPGAGVVKGRVGVAGQVLVLPGGAVLAIGETDALDRRHPHHGALDGPAGPALRERLWPLVDGPVGERVAGWWAGVSLGDVWDVLAAHGYGEAHLRRLIRNMQGLLPALRRLLRPDPGPQRGPRAALPAPPAKSAGRIGAWTSHGAEPADSGPRGGEDSEEERGRTREERATRLGTEPRSPHAPAT
jgi:hypothetical protein